MDTDLRIPIFVEKYFKKVLVASAGFSIVMSVIAPFINTVNELRIVAAVGLAVFVIFHGTFRYGWQSMIVFLTITFFIAWTMETVSIATGFPFGNYYYTELLGTKVGNIPWGIMLAYFFTGYLTWTMGNIFLRETNRGIRKKNLFFAPAGAAMLMVMWNMCFDPIMSTIEGNWVWENGGAYFGVPVSNFFGWFLTAYIIFQLFALFIYKFNKNEPINQKKRYWYLIPILFVGQGAEYLINPFIMTENKGIYRAVFFITIFTMVFASILCIIFISRNINNKPQPH